MSHGISILPLTGKPAASKKATGSRMGPRRMNSVHLILKNDPLLEARTVTIGAFSAEMRRFGHRQLENKAELSKVPQPPGLGCGRCGSLQ